MAVRVFRFAIIFVLFAFILAACSSSPSKRVKGISTPTIYNIPASFNGTIITTDCSTDDTVPIQKWLDSLAQPGPAVVNFASGGCYQIQSTLVLYNFQQFTFNGNGATLKEITTAAVYATPYQVTGLHAVYCGNNTQTFGGGGGPATINVSGEGIMIYTEGGCGLIFENFNLLGSDNLGGTNSADGIQDSLIQLNGTQQVQIINDTESNAWGDWITLSGLHEAGNNAGAFPVTNVTITGDTFGPGENGRQGISPIYVRGVNISNDTFSGQTSGIGDMFDLEADNETTFCTCDVNISNNTFTSTSSFTFLISAITGTTVDRFNFSNNTIQSTGSGLGFKIVFRPMEGSEICICNNTYATSTGFNLHPMIEFDNSPYSTNVIYTDVDIEGNTGPMPGQLVTGYVEDAASSVVNFNVRNNTLGASVNTAPSNPWAASTMVMFNCNSSGVPSGSGCTGTPVAPCGDTIWNGSTQVPITLLPETGAACGPIVHPPRKPVT